MAVDHLTLAKFIQTAQAAIDCLNACVEKTIWSSPAGKKRLAKQLSDLLPAHKTYVEPFAGSAAVLFAKEPAAIEVINDVDQEIVHAYRAIQRLSDNRLKRLQTMDWVGDEETFNKIRKSKPQSDLAKLYRFLYLTNFSYGKARRSFSPAHKGITARSVKRTGELRHRLKNVVITGGDYEQVVRKYDGKDTVFFFDPPYPEYRAEMAGGDFDENRFFNLLKSLKGRFLMTYGERGELPSLLLNTGFSIEKIQTPRKAQAMANSGPAVLDQLLVSNFELPKEKLAPLLKAVWTTAYINDLPDSAFLYIEPGGRKDEKGKTVPRTLRHFPIRDDEGKLDLPHLRNAIARIPQARIPGLTTEDLGALQDKARQMLEEAQKVRKVPSLLAPGAPSPLAPLPVAGEGNEGLGLSKQGGEGSSRSRGEANFEKTIPLIKGSNPNDERYVLGIVLEPETVDAQGDIYSAEEIRNAAHKFMEDFGGLGLMHRFRANDQVKVLESFLAPNELNIAGTKIKKGTWLLAVRILSDALWKQVKDGTYTGFSIGGSAQKIPENSPRQDGQAAVAKRDASTSDRTINRLKDMVVEEVSLVDRAANKRRFLIVKRSDPMGKKTKQPDNSKADEYQEAVEKLEALAAAGDVLAEAPGAQASGLVALASRLLKVSESIAEAAEAAGQTDIDDDGDGDALDDEPDSGTDDDGDDDGASSDDENTDAFMASVKTTLERVNTLLNDIKSGSTPPPTETPPPKPEPSNDSHALSKDLKQVFDAVKKHQHRLARLEKQYGLPNSLPSGESRGSPDENESWPRDLNAPVDRESVDKSVSFHDAPRKGVR